VAFPVDACRGRKVGSASIAALMTVTADLLKFNMMYTYRVTTFPTTLNSLTFLVRAGNEY